MYANCTWATGSELKSHGGPSAHASGHRKVSKFPTGLLSLLSVDPSLVSCVRGLSELHQVQEGPEKLRNELDERSRLMDSFTVSSPTRPKIWLFNS